ncbi:MAG TPA: TauD/TfdA family dioxygenase [Acidimicrobiales bacterium]
MTTATTTLTIKPLTAVIGAEVEGVDLREPLDDAQREAIRAALLEHQVLVFRGQNLSIDQHIAFAKQFGEVHLPPVPTKHGGPPEVNVLDQVNPKGDGADLWHSDNSYIAVPPMGSVLKAVRIPRVGGDTCFANMYEAYESLSEPMKRYVHGLTATHDVTGSLRRAVERGNADFDIEEMRQKMPPVEQPVVRIHPETGRPLLYVNEASTAYINGVSQAESTAVLNLLYDAVRSPDIQCRVRWREGDVVFFDNRCTQHYAVPDYNERRIMHRVTIRGDRPYGPS